MNFKSTLIIALLAASLGSWYYFYEVKGKPARDKAKEEQKRVFKGLERSSLQEITLHEGAGDVVLKKSGEAWQLTQPLISAVDQVVVDGLIDALYRMAKEETIDEAGANPADFGLDKPRSSATFLAASNTSKTVLFGMDNPTGQYAYAQVKGEAPIFLIMKYVRSNVMKEPKDLRDKKVWDFDPASVVKIRSSLGKGLAIDRGKSWDQGAVNGWLSQLKGLRIDTFVDGGAKNPGKYGLAGSAEKFSLDMGPKSAPLVLVRGRTMDTNKNHYFMLQGGSMVFSMAENFNQMLEKKAEDLAKKPDPTPVNAAAAAVTGAVAAAAAPAPFATKTR